MINRNKVLLMILIVMTCLVGLGTAVWAVDAGADSDPIQDKIDLGVDYLHGQFTKGRNKIDVLAEAALVAAGEDLNKSLWSKTLVSLIKEETKKLDDNSPLGTISKEMMLLNRLGETEETQRLAALLNGLQGSDGSFGFSVYEHVWPLLAFQEAGMLDNDHLDVQKAQDWLLSQSLSSGVWGYSWDGQDVEDVDATNWALRALAGFTGSGADDNGRAQAIQDGLVFLKGMQGSKGEIMNWDPGVSTGETILTLLKLNQDPTGADWSVSDVVYGESSLVDYLIIDEVQNADGSFGSFANVGGTVVPVQALAEFKSSGFNTGELEEYITSKILDGIEFLHDEFGEGRSKIDALAAAALLIGGEDIDSSRWSKSLANLIKEEASKMDENTPVGTIGKTMLVLKALGDTSGTDRLAGLLKDLQGNDGNFGFSVYEHVWPILGLEAAGMMNNKNMDLQGAKDWLLGQRLSSGIWGYSWDGQDNEDVDATNWAIRALVGFADVETSGSECEEAIQVSLAFLKGKQGSKGEISNWDPGVSTGEMILTLLQLGEDPTSEEWSVSDQVYGQKSLADYLLSAETQNLDGSFGPYQNVGGTVVPIMALAALQSSGIDPGSDGDGPGNEGNTGGEITQSIFVKIAVVGQEGDLLYGPKSVTIYENDPYKMTVLGALDNTGLSWSFSRDFDGLIVEIDGQENEGQNGWQYKVNSSIPNSLAENKKLRNGDKVIWWYSSQSSTGPNWSELESGNSNLLTPEGGNQEEEKETLVSYKDKLSSINESNAILNENKKMTVKKAEELQKALDKNKTDLELKVTGKEAFAGDGEVSLLVPEDARQDTTKITVKELKDTEQPKKFAVRLGSSVYDFGPDGTQFDEPVTMGIKVPLVEGIDINRLTPAWYDEEQGEWVPISAVIDLETGMVVFEIDHFTKFAVIEKPARVTFSDVGTELAWAKNAVEILAGQGIINGSGIGFEPKRLITRAEFIKLLTAAMELEVLPYQEGLFKDVKANDWFAGPIACAVENKIAGGDPDRRFRPADPISRNEIASVLSRLEEVAVPAAAAPLDFQDGAKIPDWAAGGVKYAVGAKLMKGYEDGTFRGNNSLTRSEAAVVIYRYLEKMTDY